MRCLLSRCHLVLLRTLILSSSSHWAALSPSHRAVWLMRHHSSHSHLVLSSSSHCTPSRHLLVQAGCCVASCCAIVAPPSHLLVILSLRHPLVPGRLTKGYCALSMTDSTTSEGWLRKPNFIEDRHLRRQLRSYKKVDPKEIQQKALPVCVLRLILSLKSTELCQAMDELAGAAHFWAMRSCKYAKVPKAEQRQTKQLCIRNIAFIRDGETLTQNSPARYPLPLLAGRDTYPRNGIPM